jgi:hypothetical protein
MDPNSAIMVVEPAARDATIGRHRVLRYCTKTAAHTFESVLLVLDDSRVIQLVARDSFHDDLAGFLLDQVVENPPALCDGGTLSVLPAVFPEPWTFDCVVAAPPTIAKRFDGRCDYLRQRVYWAFPAFRGEFSPSDGFEEFWHQLGRKDGWRIHIVNWRRTPKTARAWD